MDPYKKNKDSKKIEKQQEKYLKEQEKDLKKREKELRKHGHGYVGVGPAGIAPSVSVIHPAGMKPTIVGPVGIKPSVGPAFIGNPAVAYPSAMAYNPGVDPQVAQWFAAVDQDRSGRISASELQGALMSSNGQKFSEGACRLMIGMFDGGSGSIDINGFTHLFSYVNQWLTAFRSYDADQSGFINSHELMSALQTMGYRFSQPFVDMIAARFGDKQGRGLPVDGFIMCCILIQKFTEGFRQKDQQQQGVITIAYEDFLSLILTAWA